MRGVAIELVTIPSDEWWLKLQLLLSWLCVCNCSASLFGQATIFLELLNTSCAEGLWKCLDSLMLYSRTPVPIRLVKKKFAQCYTIEIIFHLWNLSLNSWTQLRMIHCLASAKPWLGKKSPRLGPKPCRGSSNFSISLVCSKKFKYWQINNMNWWRVKIFLSVRKNLNFFFA